MFTNKATCYALLAALLLPGCAATVPVNPYQRPTLVDPARTDMVRYEHDYYQCVQLANQTDAQQSSAANAAAGAVAGAVLGAVVGAIIGAAFNDAGTGAAYGAALGGVDGGVAGAAGGYTTARVDQETALRNCLRGRGYYIIR